jgi:DNA-binding transcriptional MerR regulator
MTDEKQYTISELADATGVTPRTIRYYTAEGLLPPPDTRGRYALYGDEHLLRLQLIARLKDAYLPLGEIKARTDQLDAEQLRRLLAEYHQPPQQQIAESATEYITRVLSNHPVAPDEQETSPMKAQPFLGRPALRHESARARDSEPPAPPAPPLKLGHAESVPVEPAPAAPAAPQPRGSLLSRLVPRRRAQPEEQAPAAPSAAEQWQRITLAPGVELHIREPLPDDLHARVQQLLAQARELLDDDTMTR